MAKVQGTFTKYQFSREVGRLEKLVEEAEDLKAKVDEVERVKEEGEVPLKIKLIKGLLAHPETEDVCTRLDEADEAYLNAVKALKRCKINRDNVDSMSPTAKRRSREALSARTVAREAAEALDQLARRKGVYDLDIVPGGCPKGGRRQQIKDLLKKNLAAVQVDRKTTERLKELKRQIRASRYRRDAMADNLITEKKIRQFANYLEPYSRQQLVALMMGEFTIRNDPYCLQPNIVYRDMAALGLIDPTTWLITDLGRDIAAWIRGHREQLLPLRDTTREEIKSLFTPEQIQNMVKKGKSALRYIRQNEDEPLKTVELGIPKDGFSYKIKKTKEAIEMFLGQFCSRERPPSIKMRVKKPVFVPGEILA